MKKLITFIFAAMCAVLFSGCECDKYDYVEVDYDFSEDVVMIVKNEAGDNLLDPEVNGNILDQEITVEYDGGTFPIGDPSPETRATVGITPPIMPARVLRIEPLSEEDSTPVLKFGKFLPRQTNNYSGSGQLGPVSSVALNKFTINWGDGDDENEGTSDEITFDYAVSWEWVKYPAELEYRHEATRHYYIGLNVEYQPDPAESLTIEIVK